MKVRNTLPFAIVPEWLLDSEVSDRAVRLYGVLMRYADQEGHAHPTRRTLAKRLRCSVDTIDRAIAELVAAGALEVEHRDRDEGPGQTSNDYVLLPGGRTDAAPPLGTGAAPLNESHLERDKAQNPTGSSLSRGGHRDLVWDAVDIVYGKTANDSERNRRSKVVKLLRQTGATPEEIVQVANSARNDSESYVQRMAATDTALANNWSRILSAMEHPTNGNSVAGKLMREAAELDRRGL